PGREKPGLSLPHGTSGTDVAAWVKRSPPKRLRNASAVAISGKQNRIWNCSTSCRLRPRRTGMRRSRWNVSISRKTLRKPPGGSASSTRCGKSCSFARPVISRLRRVISPNPPEGTARCTRNIMPIARGYSRAFNLFYLRVSDRSIISSPRTLVFGGLVGGDHENSVHGRSAPSGTCSADWRSRLPASRAYLSQVLGSGGLDRGRSEKSKKAAAHGPQGRCRQVCRVGRRQARILVFRLRRDHRLLCYPIPR